MVGCNQHDSIFENTYSNNERDTEIENHPQENVLGQSSADSSSNYEPDDSRINPEEEPSTDDITGEDITGVDITGEDITGEITGRSTDETADVSAPSEVPPRRSQKPIRLPLVDAGEANDQDQSPFNQTFMAEIELSKISLNQKGGKQLLIKENGKIKSLVLVGYGVNRKGLISWTCNQKGCKGSLKTQIKNNIDDYVLPVQVGTRKRNILNPDNELSVDNLKKISRIEHTCGDRAAERVVLNRIGQEAEKLVNELPKEPVRRPLRSEIREMAIKNVMAELDKESLKRKPLNLPPSAIPRKISRAIKGKYAALDPEISVETKPNYIFDDDWTNDDFRLDRTLADQQANDILLFTCEDLLKYMTTNDHWVIADGTFPVPRKNKVFEQLWCLVITSKDRTILCAYAWMTRKNQSSYEKILNRSIHYYHLAMS